MAGDATPALAWEGGLPPDMAATERAVLASIAADLEGLEKPADLIFHVVMLSEDDDGPNVTVSGREGSDAFHCEYAPATEWGAADEG